MAGKRGRPKGYASPTKGVKHDYSKPSTSVAVERINSADTEYLENGMPVVDISKKKYPMNSERQRENVKPGDNARYLRHSLAMWDLPVLDISDPEAVRERIGWYFMHCAESDMKPTVTGLALALGTTVQTLKMWTDGASRRETHMDMIRQAKMVIEDQMNSYMENGKINPVAGIFLLKNHFGYRDQQETIITPNTTMGEAVDTDEMRQKYLDILSDDVTVVPDDDGEE